VANDSIQAPKMPEQNKAKKGRNLKRQKTWAGFWAFANLALAKAQVKNKRSSNFRHKKIEGKYENRSKTLL